MKSISVNQKIAIVSCLLLTAFGVSQLLSPVMKAHLSPDTDLLRQWRVAQYVRAGVNPYPVALAALRARYGILAPKGPVHLRETRIYMVPRSGPDPATNPDLGPPEATYPPTSVMLFAVCMAPFQASTVRAAWLVLNLLFLFLILRELLLLLEFAQPPWLAAGLIFALIVAWPPVAYCFEREQFSLFVLWVVLLASRLQSVHPFLAGALWCLALIKPSLALPYILLPLAARRWKVLATTVSLQAVLLISAAVHLHEAPWTLVKQWLSVAAYLRQGTYTVQDWINNLHLDGTILDILLPVALLALAFPVVQKLTRVRALAFLSFVSAFWMYHSIYDFVVLLVPGALLIPAFIGTREKSMYWLISTAAFLAIGIALLPIVHNGEAAIYHVLRWVGRLSLIASLVLAAQPETFTIAEFRRRSPWLKKTA